MTISTYHCLCTELVLATPSDLSKQPKRELDGASICKLGGACTLTSAATVDEKATVLKLEDGFEKRYAIKCARCGLLFAYQLDLSQFEESKAENGRREDVVYVLAGALPGEELRGLMSTEEMLAGKAKVSGVV
ncbi:hypothetical protein TI39_contig357g00022 [Zymoseptoria brevis]|uniref:STEEP1 domain-containing protein n=1 Tax=Zymoseptoria brevis TaxID=1047168 RepID=A0A0F4GQH1_9PEZI|nr:hypothetical protein TI39_contig357g00022 [Zymoseptoria brevis]